MTTESFLLSGFGADGRDVNKALQSDSAELKRTIRLVYKVE